MRTEKTTVALRVLTAIHEDREPDERDVMLIHAFCGESEQDLDVGEMACLIIQRALKARKLRRKQ